MKDQHLLYYVVPAHLAEFAPLLKEFSTRRKCIEEAVGWANGRFGTDNVVGVVPPKGVAGGVAGIIFTHGFTPIGWEKSPDPFFDRVYSPAFDNAIDKIALTSLPKRDNYRLAKLLGFPSCKNKHQLGLIIANSSNWDIVMAVTVPNEPSWEPPVYLIPINQREFELLEERLTVPEQLNPSKKEAE